jgi:hypothetical protein
MIAHEFLKFGIGISLGFENWDLELPMGERD